MVWYAQSNVFTAKGEWVEPGIEGHEVCDSKNVQVRYRLGEEPMEHIKLLLPKVYP